MVEFCPATIKDALTLAEELREADRDELLAASGDVEHAVRESLRLSPAPIAAHDATGLVALFGCAPIGPLLTPVGAPWLLGTDRLARHPGVLVRESRRYLAGLREVYPMLVNYVDVRNKASIRYLRLVGFALDTPVPFGVAGMLFHRFHMGL